MSEAVSDIDEGSFRKRRRIRNRAKAIKDFQCKHVIAVLENPADMFNIGSVIRNANALGVGTVYVVDPSRKLPDDWQEMRERRKLSKLSVSAVKWTFVKRFDSTADCLEHLAAKGFVSVVTSPHVKGKQSLYLHEADFTKPAKLAVWFGTEGKGISDEAVEAAEKCVAIPMFGMIESFNLGTSSGIVLYEVTKQRRAYQSQFKRSRRREPREEPLPVVMEPRQAQS